MPTNIKPKTVQGTALQRSGKMTLQEQLVAILTDDIEKGVYRTGERLPSVRELAERYQISRETAKLALGTMQDAGIIEILPSRGAFVRGTVTKTEHPEKYGMIGLLLHVGNEEDAVHDVQLVYDRLLQTLDSEACRYDLHVITAYIDPSRPEGLERMDRMIQRIDGLCVIGLHTEDLLQYLRDLPIPVISILSNIDVEHIDDIGSENERSYRIAADYLLDRGCRDLVYVDGPGTYHQGERRFAGCRSAVAARPGEDLQLRHYRCRGWGTADAKRGFIEVLAERKPDGVLCVNDITAAGVMQACSDAGLSVPGDISVIGAKNTMLCESMDPPLTSIECYFDEIARVAMERLTKRISGITYRPARIEIAGELHVRGSCDDRTPGGVEDESDRHESHQ
jgi:DNA-binding LacI/PurR family transcriptional regulator